MDGGSGALAQARLRVRPAAPRLLALLCLAVAGACAAPGYSPCPLDLPEPLDDRAFARCRDVLLREYGALTVVDRDAFLLQTDWQPTADPPGERRASLFRDAAGRTALAIVVETRRLTVPLIGPPRWTDPRGDPAAERALAEQLHDALTQDGLP